MIFIKIQKKDFSDNSKSDGANDPKKSREKRQRKGEKQLEDLTSLVDYITKKLDEYEEERKKKDEEIRCLQELVKHTETNMTLEQ